MIWDWRRGFGSGVQSQGGQKERYPTPIWIVIWDNVFPGIKGALGLALLTLAQSFLFNYLLVAICDKIFKIWINKN